MPTAWFRRVQRAGELTVFNKAGSWSSAMLKALTTFNSLNFPVKLTETKDEKNANIVVKVSTGSDSITSWGNTAKTGADFDPKLLHGLTSTVVETHQKPRPTREIVFAGIFLPGQATATAAQKEVIIVHEFIHACGLNGDGTKPSTAKDQDHDKEGIMYDIMMPDGDGLIEGSKPAGVKAMPPVRIGSQTRCKIQMIWGTEACKE